MLNRKKIISYDSISRVIAVSMFLLATQLVAQTQTVEGVGMGMTRDAAMSGAKRDAVEKGVGVVIASETMVKNFQVASDKILSKANGFVKTYQEISSIQDSDGLWTITITAEVTDILDELVKDQLALDLLLSWVRHPRFMIMIDEVNIDDPNTTIAATELGRLLGAKGFDLVSAAQSETLRQRGMQLANAQGDANAAAGIAADLGAEYLIMGNATSKAVTHPMLGSRLSGQANISAQVIRVDNAQIIAQESFHGKSTHIDASTAGAAALKKAAAALSEYLMAETVKRWSLEQSNARVLTLKISGPAMSYQSRRDVINFLIGGAVDGVKNVDQRSYTAGLLTLAVEYTGSNEDMGMAIDGRDLGNFVLYISGESPNGFDILAQNK